MALTVLHLDTEPDSADWLELSDYAPADDGFLWQDLLAEGDLAASHQYTADVRRMLHAVPGARARLEELGGLLLITTVREAMRLAVCVLRLEEIGELRRSDADRFVFTSTKAGASAGG
ncbi:hypothetical protein ACFWVF_19005 [Streptomyces sp. NPDC058659]|uniref:hypothetical protein n=1 Tax=Streptomyces sp. NPDC058659 TaxID=3346581 RepID=UPI003659B801